MTKYGVDMTNPPTPEQASEMARLGWTVCCVYVGGPRAAAHDAWQNGPVGELEPFFPDGFVPITVVRNAPWDSAADIGESAEGDAQQAASDMGACGFDDTAVMVVDMEYGTYRANPGTVRQYVLAYNARSTTYNPNRKLYLYSDEQTCQALGDLFDGTFMASWQEAAMDKRDWQAPDGQYDPSEPPPSAAWQFGGGTLAGVSVDFDSFADDFPFARYAL